MIWPKSDIRTWISTDISMDIHIHSNPELFLPAVCPPICKSADSLPVHSQLPLTSAARNDKILSIEVKLLYKAFLFVGRRDISTVS